MEYKNYKIDTDPMFGMKTIKPIGKGSVNKELRGSFTTVKRAQLAIDKFLADKEGQQNGKVDIGS